MDGICNLLKPVIDGDSKNETLRNLLLSCYDQRSFTKCTSGISSFVGLTNGKLNEPASRYDGLLLLQTFLPQCSIEVLTQNFNSWVQFCLKGATSGATAQLSFVVLKMLLSLSETVPELSRHVSSIVVANFAELINQGISPQAYVNALECLELCMKKYNGPCGPHKKVIDGFLQSLLEYSGPKHLLVYWHAARCMALLPQTGGGGVGGAQYKLAWASKQKQLIRTIHIILDDLYTDTNELPVSMMGGMLEGIEPLPLPLIDDSDPILRTQRLGSRLIALSGCLQAMLIMAYPVPKNVSISSIMNLICRGLAVNGSSIGVSNTTHTLALSAELPKVHHSLLKLLEALILLGRSNLLPFASMICRLCIQTLKWTCVEDWPYGTEKPYKHVRAQAYAVLKVWCGTVKGGSGVEDFAQQFIDVSLLDIFSEKDSVTLSANLRKKNNHQRRSKGHTAVVSVGNLSKDGLILNQLANKDVCVAALQAFTAVVMAASSRIQASVHKTLQETVVTVLIKSSTKVEESPIPYSAPSARLELYRLLLQLVLDCHTVWPAPTNIALKLFASGLHDPDAQISMFCGMAQGVMEKIIHPAYPSLYITPSHREVDASVEAESHDMAHMPVSNVFINQDLSGNNSEDAGHDLTDAVSLAPKKEEARISVGSRTSPRLSNGHASSSKKSASIHSHLVTSSATESTPLPSKPVNARVVIVQATPICITDSSDQEDNSQSISSPTLNGKLTADSSVKEDKNAQKPIDLTNSDMSDDEISEVPCEIDLADSEDEKAGSDGEKSNLSISSQTTVNTPIRKEAHSDENVSKLILKTSPFSKENEASEETETEVIQSSFIAVSKENKLHEESSVMKETEVSAVNGTSGTNGISEADNGDGASESGKRAVEVEDEGSASKRAKMDDDDLEFPSDEDSMLLSFVDVTRDEEDV